MSKRPREKGSNHKESIDDVANIKELQKQGVRDEQGLSNTDADENLESKGHTSDSDEDVKSGSESNAGSDAEGVTGVIRIENPKRKKLQLLQRLTSLNAFFADTSEPASLFIHEREKTEEEQQQNCENLHPHGNTEQPQAGLSSNVADETIRTREENEKRE